MLDNGFPQVLIKAWFMKIVTVPSFPGIQAWSRLEGRAKQKKDAPIKFLPNGYPYVPFRPLDEVRRAAGFAVGRFERTGCDQQFLRRGPVSIEYTDLTL